MLSAVVVVLRLLLRLLPLPLFVVDCGLCEKHRWGGGVDARVASLPAGGPFVLMPSPAHVPGATAEGFPGAAVGVEDREKRGEGRATGGGTSVRPSGHHSRPPRSALKVLMRGSSSVKCLC